MGKILKYLPAVISLLCVLTACNNVGCTDNQSSIPLAGFYDSETGREVSLSGLTAGGIGAPNDSLICSNETLTEIYLPLRANRDTTSFVFRYRAQDNPGSGAWADTLRFGYTATPYLASADCGVTYRYRIHKVEYTRILIDSVGIAPGDSMIDNVDMQRIRIYFRSEQ